MVNYSAFHWSEKARKYAETIGTIFNVKGRVNTVADLPSTGNKVGDLWLVGLTTDPDLIEYAWLSFDNVTRWEKLGSTATSTAFSALTGSPYDNTALKNALDAKYDASNPDGYITGITSGDVTTALGYTPYNSSNPSGYISSITSLMVTTALGYTPYNSTNPNGYQANVLEGVQVNGTDMTITNKKVNVTVPTDTGDLTNGAGFITSSALVGKVDLDLNNMNPSATAKATIVGWGMPDYSAITTVSYPYTAVCDGIANVYGAGSGSDTVKVNGANIGCVFSGTNGVTVLLNKGDILEVTGSEVAYIYFIPLKGVNNA